MNITSNEKAEMLKTTITHLYSNEGRSISYISRLLEINRKTLSDKIKDWKLPEAEPRHHIKPSTQKFINTNRNLIKARLDINISISQIAKELKVSRDFLQKAVIPNDDVLNKARNDYMNRQAEKANAKKAMSDSKLDYTIIDEPNEIWKPIIGFPGYFISNNGRVKHLSKRYHAFHLIQAQPNKTNGRLYVALYNNTKHKNIQVANLVAHNFVNGYSSIHCTVNHKDCDILNNHDWNLEWASQSENNIHAYRKLNRTIVNKRKYKFKKIIYKDKYEFKTIAAFAKFLNKSETQTRRYLDEPDKYDIKFDNNCND